MNSNHEVPLAAFTRRFRRSPVRWVVLVHVVLLGSLIALRSTVSARGLLYWLDASLVIAQGALLVIWIALNGDGTARRTVGAAVLLSLIQLAHLPIPQILVAAPGMLCTVPSMYIMLAVVSLPMLVAQSKGMELMRFDTSRMPPARRMQFSIRAAMIASVCAALLFGLRGVAESAFSENMSLGPSIAAFVTVAAMILVALGIYLSIPLVAVWAVLTPGKVLPRMATAAAGWTLGGMLIFHYTSMADGRGHVALPVSATAGATAILLVTLFVLRAMRYRVVWNGDVGDSPFRATSPFAGTGERLAIPPVESNPAVPDHESSDPATY